MESTEIVQTATATADFEAETEDRGPFLVARSPQEMKQAQGSLADWFDKKMKEEQRETKELRAMLNEARAHKWKTSAIQARLVRHLKRVTFYDKCAQAVRAGYYLIPSFPIDVFAIRTDRKKPLGESSPSSFAAHRPPDQTARELPPGEGRYVAVQASGETLSYMATNKDGKDVEMWFQQAKDFQDIEFPISVATPLVMTATGEATAMKLFDEIGICPPSRSKSRDPMVIGRVKLREGYQDRSLSFLIAWCIDLRTL